MEKSAEKIEFGRIETS